MTDSGEVPAIALEGIAKSFSGVRVLHGVELAAAAGEVHALVGENGAGKSTLMKIAAGIHQPESGRMVLHGKPYQPHTPREALRLGVAMVHQELSLAPDVSVAENVLAGIEPCRAGLIHWKALYARAEALLTDLGQDLPLRAPVSALSLGERQIVEILKGLAAEPSVMIFDEPTSSLEAAESAVVMGMLRKLAARRIAVVFISHRMDEVFQVADRITVLRDGRLVWTRRASEVSVRETVNAMVGRELSGSAPSAPQAGAELLRAEGLTRHGTFANVSFALHGGEILGFAGLVGAGRTELMRAVFGADVLDSGRLWLRGKPVRFRTPRRAMDAGVAYVPEDRKTLGLFLDRSLEDNVVCASLGACSRRGFIRARVSQDLAYRFSERLGVRAASLTQEARSLSGGNQQKALLARWLATKPAVLIADEPTRGVDVGAKAEIHRLLRSYANSGYGVIVVSSDMPEILALCDRIIVLREGSVAGQLTRSEATERALIRLAVEGGACIPS